MKETDQTADLTGKKLRIDKSRIEQAEARTEQAETRTEQAKTRTEQAETRTEQAETRTESAKTRTEQAEIRTEQAETQTEQAETALQREVQKEQEDVYQRQTISTHILKHDPLNALPDPMGPLTRLTGRQRETLQLIAAGRNTKQIAEALKLSPKTVEYHRMKLMNILNLHDIPALVRFAMQAGLLPQGN